ncbi:transposable element Tcb1 transposase [Trichonephila clavipes]|nr:transposable element Tcb1 transposase [Trichonephila clavipes]
MAATSASFIPTPLAHADTAGEEHSREASLQCGESCCYDHVIVACICVPPGQKLEPQRNCTRDFGDGPCSFEPWSSDVVIPELAHPSPKYHTTLREDILALDRFSVRRCPTWQILSGDERLMKSLAISSTLLKFVGKQAYVRLCSHEPHDAESRQSRSILLIKISRDFGRFLGQKKQAADSGEIARHTTQVTGRPISRFTVARRLDGGGLFARRHVRCVTLTPAHRRRRYLWCREHRNWRDNEWDEYSLQMRADSV